MSGANGGEDAALCVEPGPIAAPVLARVIGMLAARVVDVRRAPASRRDPQFGREAMQAWLRASGVSYRWEPELGGWRRPPPGSPDRALREAPIRRRRARLLSGLCRPCGPASSSTPAGGPYAGVEHDAGESPRARSSPVYRGRGEPRERTRPG